MKWTEGMEDLFKFIAKYSDNLDAIIISDSNEQFIQWILEVKGFEKTIKHVFSN